MAQSTTIAPQTTVNGAISGQGALEVQGTTQGTISLEGTLTVAPSGHVHGEATVTEAILQGHFEGKLKADRIVLESGAQVSGQLNAPVIRMDDGAKLQGEIEMDFSAPAPAPRATQASKAPVTSSAPARSAAPPVSQQPSQAAVATEAPPLATTTVVVEEEPAQETTTEKVTFNELEISEALLAKYDDYTVKDLRESLRQYDLPVSGSKSELIERLVIHESS